MANLNERDKERIAARRVREHFNLFARLPAIYAASRKQGQHLLQIGGGLSIVEYVHPQAEHQHDWHHGLGGNRQRQRELQPWSHLPPETVALRLLEHGPNF